MKQEKIMKYLNITTQIMIVTLLSIWFFIPILKEIVKLSSFIQRYEYIFMEFVGIIGIYILVLKVYKNFNKSENKREYLKEILPIVILSIYMIWTLISCVFSPNKNFAFYGTEYRKDGYLTYLIYAGFFALAYILASNKYKKILLNLFLIIAVSTIILMELANHKILFQIFWMKNTTIGIFENSNHYGYYLLLATIISNMLFLTEKSKAVKVIYAVVYSFLLYYLILNNTLGCYLALFVTLIMLFIYYYIYINKTWYLPIISIIIFIIMSCLVQTNGKNIAVSNIKSLGNDFFKILYLLEKSDNENKKIEAGKAGSGRIRLWVNGTKFFIERPLLGYGPENLREKYKEVGIDQDRAHNLIVQLATTSGLPGLLLYITAIRNHVKKVIY